MTAPHGTDPLTIEVLKTRLDYDPETGIFTKKITSGGYERGRVAGNTNAVGYVCISILRKKYLAHRLAWLYMTGEWPLQIIDHIDGDRTNNRIANLRDVSFSINMQNLKRCRSDNKSGLLGVCWAKRDRKWVAQIKYDGVPRFLGYFDDKNEAHEAYLIAKRNRHEGCTI